MLGHGLVMTDAGRYSFLPDQNQERLLEVILADADVALAAWNAWRSANDLDYADARSLKLLPMVAHRLGSLAPNEPLLPRLRGIQRWVLSRNLVLFHHAARALRALEAAGVEMLLLKGAPLSRLVYPDPGRRPMGDLDVLVHEDALPRAIQALAADGGFQPVLRFPERRPLVLNSQAFRREGRELDLHTHVLVEGVGVDDADGPFWAASQPQVFEGVPLRILGPSDLLLHACVHGAAFNADPSLCWVLDAALVLRHWRGRIDWDRLLEQTRRLRVELPLEVTLSAVARFEPSVPSDVLARLREQRPNGVARRYFASRARPATRWNSLPRLWHDYRFRLAAEQPLGRATLGFPAYLRRRWDLAGLWELAPAVLERARRFPGRV